MTATMFMIIFMTSVDVVVDDDATRCHWNRLLQYSTVAAMKVKMKLVMHKKTNVLRINTMMMADINITIIRHHPGNDCDNAVGDEE